MLVFLRLSNLRSVSMGDEGETAHILHGAEVELLLPIAGPASKRLVGVRARKILLVCCAGAAADYLGKMSRTDLQMARRMVARIQPKQRKRCLARYQRNAVKLAKGILAPAIRKFAEHLLKRGAIGGDTAERFIWRLLGIAAPYRGELQRRQGEAVLAERCRQSA